MAIINKITKNKGKKKEIKMVPYRHCPFLHNLKGIPETG